VWYVDQDDCIVTGGFGSSNDPYCALEDALSNIDSGESGTIVLRHADEPYTVPLTAPGGAGVLAVRGEGDPVVQWSQAAAHAPGGSRLYLEGLRLQSVDLHGVSCDAGASLWLDEMHVEAAGHGIDGDDCQVTVRRSVITNSLGGGVSLAGGSLVAVGSSISGNGEPGQSSPGIRLAAASLELVYSTVVGNHGLAPGSGIWCEPGSSVSIRNSIVAGDDAPALGCEAATVETSATDRETQAGEGNVLYEYRSADFQDPLDGDVHLRNPAISPFLDVARWREGDPMSDIDGDARLAIDGASDYAGADLP
jgi:hypothetical protein